MVSKKPVLLLVDDDPMIVDSLSVILEDEYEILSAESRMQARELIRQAKKPPSMAMVDLGLPPTPHTPDEGFQLINELIIYNPDMKILVLSGQGEKANIQHAMTLGAVDFIPKPCDIPLLKTRLAHQVMMLEAEIEKGGGEYSGENLIGESKEIKNLHSVIKQFADTPFPVLIQGESGSGKELVAQYLHEQSARSDLPFLTLNCAAFTAELLESQLFGHAKGSFTGATQNKTGFFEEASEGSLCLDEIGELPLDLQSKLLRVLENGEFYRVGETQPRISNARIIASTNKDLEEETRTNRFRQDLYHRLGVLNIFVPPLRERGEDCLVLLSHFRELYAMGNAPFSLNKEAETMLLNYSFPGNVRELRNITIRLSAKYPGQDVGVDLLSNELETTFTSTIASDDSWVQEVEQHLQTKGFRLDDQVKEWETRYITNALRISGGNLSKAARILGVNRTTLYSRIQRLSIEFQEDLVE
jgi:DNA-binding NtrC family response regulator